MGRGRGRVGRGDKEVLGSIYEEEAAGLWGKFMESVMTRAKKTARRPRAGPERAGPERAGPDCFPAIGHTNLVLPYRPSIADEDSHGPFCHGPLSRQPRKRRYILEHRAGQTLMSETVDLFKILSKTTESVLLTHDTPTAMGSVR